MRTSAGKRLGQHSAPLGAPLDRRRLHLRDEHLSVVLATRRRLARVVAVVLAQDARPCGDARLAPQLHRHQLEDAVQAVEVLEHFDTADRHPRIKAGEAGWILEDNTSMNRGMEAMGARVVKRFRMYGREWPKA